MAQTRDPRAEQQTDRPTIERDISTERRHQSLLNPLQYQVNAGEALLGLCYQHAGNARGFQLGVIEFPFA